MENRSTLTVDFPRLRCTYDGLGITIGDNEKYIKMSHFEFIELTKGLNSAIKTYRRDLSKRVRRDDKQVNLP